MPRQTLRLLLSPSCRRELNREKADVQILYNTDPHKSAKDPRLIAFIALDQMIYARVPNNFELYTYVVPDELVREELRPLRCADSFGWRLFFKLSDDNRDIQLIRLMRVTNFRDRDLRRAIAGVRYLSVAGD